MTLDEGLKVEKSFTADEGFFSNVHRVTHDTVKHPRGNFNRSAAILCIDTTPQDRLSGSDVDVKDDDGAAIPRMPRVADLLGFGNMGVELLVCITLSVRIRARGMSCCFQRQAERAVRQNPRDGYCHPQGQISQ